MKLLALSDKKGQKWAREVEEVDVSTQLDWV